MDINTVKLADSTYDLSAKIWVDKYKVTLYNKYKLTYKYGKDDDRDQ